MADKPPDEATPPGFVWPVPVGPFEEPEGREGVPPGERDGDVGPPVDGTEGFCDWLPLVGVWEVGGVGIEMDWFGLPCGPSEPEPPNVWNECPGSPASGEDCPDPIILTGLVPSGAFGFVAPAWAGGPPVPWTVGWPSRPPVEVGVP
jgi:hypothetical protein